MNAAEVVSRGHRPQPSSAAGQPQSGTESARGEPPRFNPAQGITAAHITVVDDDEAVRHYVGRLLGQYFSDVVLAADGGRALEMARANPPDLILSDVLMPGLNGLALVHELRSDPRTQHVPIVLISGCPGEESTLEALEAGADDYVVKPFSARELLARIGVHLRMAQVRRQAAEQQAASVALRRLLAEKDEFISLASHEFRTPLTIINLQADGLLRALTDPELPAPQAARLRKRVEMVKSSAFRMEALIDGLLNVLALRDRPSAPSEPTDLALVARESIARFESAAARAGSSLRLSGSEKLVGSWNRKALEHILSSLLSNALKFGCGRPVDVQLEADEARARISVRDHGIGIDPRDREQIFQRFGRAVSEMQYGGLGLGLWVVHNLVQAMGGSVNVESAPGCGALFTVALPRNGYDPALPGGEPPPSGSANGHRGAT